MAGSEKFCGKCGNENINEAKFCTNCGVKLGSDLNNEKIDNIEIAQKNAKPQKNEVYTTPKDDQVTQVFTADGMANNKESKDWAKQIKSAGTAAQVMGWILIAGAPLYELLQYGAYDNYARLALYLLILMPVSLYLIISGKYISSYGKNSKIWLSINAIISIPLMGGILPVLLLINSVKGFSAFKKLKKVGGLKIDRGDDALRYVILIIIFIFITLIGSLVFYTSVLSYYSNNSTQITAEGKLGKYVYSNNMFSAEFSGEPEIELKKDTSNGYDFSYTTYLSGDDTESRMVVVYDYSNINNDMDESKALPALIEGISKASKGASVAYSNLQAVYGYTGIDSLIYLPVDGYTHNMYIKAFIVNKKVYLISTIGSSKDTFDRFFSSFKLV